jgi:signal transduction histidine kinase/ActR/RegA family two-component response regulator
MTAIWPFKRRRGSFDSSDSSADTAAQPRWSIARRVGAAVAVVIVVMLLDLASTVWGVVQLGDVNQQIQQRDIPLRADTDALLVALINEETGLRGYLLTNNQSFQAPFRQGQSAYTQLVSRLGVLTAHDEVISADLKQLAAQVTAYETGYVSPTLGSAGTQTPQQTAAATAQGKALFDQIRAAQARLANGVDAATNADFAQASSVRLQIISGVIVRAVIGVGLGILLLLLALRAIQRPIANLREVARALKGGHPVSARSRAAPPELAEIHDTIVAAAFELQERETALASANAELEEASRLKSEFLATMSHELRTPLNAILGFTDLVRSGATGSIAPQTDDYLERVRRNGAVLLDLINDVLDLSKIESGRLVVSHEVVAVEPIVREVIANVQTLADAKKLTLHLIAEEADVLAIADRRAVKQVVTNLVGNAVKFTNEGSVTVVIRTRNGATLVEVADTGPGIAPDDQAAVFEPFRQVGAHARTGTGGTGLGLPISVRLARLMGGDLRLSSDADKGSRFILRLPAVQGYSSVSRESGGPVILGVDDDLDALSLWQAQCERMGFVFVGVQQSSAAITAAATLRPSAILLDIVFPETSGWDILQQLRADRRTSQIPVHVISITDGQDRASDAAVRFLQKPVSEEQLRAELAPYQRAAAQAVA